jgi:ATP-dependent DNA helicase RecG
VHPLKVVAPANRQPIVKAIGLIANRAWTLALPDESSNTRHPMRVVGLNRVRLDEYPASGLREALGDAVAHRQYEDAGRKIMLEVFADRVVVSSPGLPPAPITLAALRRGKYRPCSRNPVLAQCLSYFHRIEERGSGFRRMRDQMLDHGVDQPLLGTDTG